MRSKNETRDDAGGEDAWPSLLKELKFAGKGSETALGAFGGLLSFLRSVLLDRSVVGLAKLERLEARVSSASPESGQPQFVALDGAALENLEVLEAAGGGTTGSLFSALDGCATPAGRRKLKDWLCRPLGRVADVIARQDAVEALMTHASEAATAARTAFARVGDLERCIARLCASRLGGVGRDAAAVVLYEDAAKRRVQAFLATLRGLQRLQEALAGFQKLEAGQCEGVLGELVTPGRRLPAFGAPLAELLAAADWEAAAEQGRIIPNKGVDESYDEARTALETVDQGLQDYLGEVKSKLKADRNSNVRYISLGKDSHVIEIPDELASRVPASFELAGQRKGFRRYTTPDLQTQLGERAKALQAREEALATILQGMVARFAEQQALWNGAVAAMAELDALMALAAAAEQAAAWGPVCRPTFVQPSAGGGQVFRATELRHAVGAALATDFVPNDVDLSSPSFIVITGPNMGGKSTMLRQVCLAAMLAHVGAWVPARSLELSPVDAIFVRMGARDSILTGQSTFFVELTETAAALNWATANSLVALDELGRGTSTSDGAAIASAVLTHLASTVKCRGLFATHYHRLAEEHATDANIAIRHMGLKVSPGDESGEQVTFLYKLAEGACPKSYGTNVARLAGIPAVVVAKAAAFASQLEEKAGNGAVQAELSEIERQKLQKITQILRNGIGSEGELVAELQGCR